MRYNYLSINSGSGEQTLASLTALPTGTWTHVAVTLDSASATGTLYLNGAAVATGAITICPDGLLAANVAGGLQQNYLARAPGGVMPSFRGALDDVQFYGAALNAAAVAAMQPPTVPAAVGTLYVDLRASDSNAGSASWSNRGTSGAFAVTSSPTLASNVQGTGVPGVLFNGTDQAYTGANTTPDIDGSSDRSIEVRAYTALQNG